MQTNITFFFTFVSTLYISCLVVYHVTSIISVIVKVKIALQY